MNFDVHICYYEKNLWHNGKTDKQITINLFGITLLNKVEA